jgi:hypothetical protein
MPGPSSGAAGGGEPPAARYANFNRRRPEAAPALRLGGERLLGRRERRPADVADDLPAGDHRRILERQSGGAEGAFRHRPADIPMGPPAARAVIGLMVAIDDVIAALARLGDQTAAAGLKDTRRHWMAPSQTRTCRPNAPGV